MHVIELKHPFDYQEEAMPAAQVLAIGDFDGVHLGHRAVIERAIRTAKEQGLPVSIMTFHPHPREILGADKYRQILTPLPDKLELFRQMGVDNTILVAFDRSFSDLSPLEFVRDILLKLNLRAVVVGFDFTFGSGGSGTAPELGGLSAGQFAVHVVEPYCQEGSKVSSTLIREAIQEGRLDDANGLLGRYYSVSGEVVEGEGRGRKMNYPTANIGMSLPYVVPKNGVYAVKVKLRGQTYGGVMNIGVKPTFTGDGIRTLEAHIFDFADSIYGETVAVEFVRMLREERKFPSVNELIAQITADADAARGLFAQNKE